MSGRARMQASPKNKFDPDGTIEGLVGPDTTGALRIERIFEMFGDPKDEQLGRSGLFFEHGRGVSSRSPLRSAAGVHI